MSIRYKQYAFLVIHDDYFDGLKVNCSITFLAQSFPRMKSWFKGHTSRRSLSASSFICNMTALVVNFRVWPAWIIIVAICL